MSKIAVFDAATVVSATVLVFAGLRHTTATIADSQYQVAVFGLVAVLVVLLGPLVLLAHVRRVSVLRNRLVLVLISAFCVAGIPYSVQQRKISQTSAALMRHYRDLAEAGPPFPLQSDVKARIEDVGQAISLGCWVSADRSTFELFYHVSSDTAVLRYPNGRWEWRGYRYVGPTQSEMDADKP